MFRKTEYTADLYLTLATTLEALTETQCRPVLYDRRQQVVQKLRLAATNPMAAANQVLLNRVRFDAFSQSRA